MPAIVLWYLLQRKNTSAKARLSRAEAINRLIDKFVTAKEVIEFLETRAGEEVPGGSASSTGERPRNRVLRFLQFGVVFVFVGIGFFVNAYRLGFETDVNFLREAMEQRFWGTFSLSIGLGLLLVSYLTRHARQTMAPREWPYVSNPM